jgi:hypothetical protein
MFETLSYICFETLTLGVDPGVEQETYGQQQMN